MYTALKVLTPVVLLAVASTADAAVSAGRVKAINADEQTFVMTDSNAEDWTLSMGKDLLINRAGKENQAGLKVGDDIQVCYEKGVIANTAHYVLVQDADHKDAALTQGAVKTFDATAKKLTVTDADGRDWTYPINSAKIRRARQETTDADIKAGDQALIVTHGAGVNAKAVMVLLDHK